MYQAYHQDQFTISTDPARLNLEVIHDFLSNQSHWAKGISREVLTQAIAHSLCFGLYESQRQIGFARVITDHATYAYLNDVFILESYRGQGLAKWLLACILAYPSLQGLRRFSLTTRDSHELYEQFGFKPLHYPERHMEWLPPDYYTIVS